MRYLLIFILLSLKSVSGQTELIKELNKSIIEIKTISSDSSFDDVNDLIPALKNVSIIGLGEATHGTHEFFVYKSRLIKFLIIEEGFKTIIIEGGFTGSILMNDYITNGKGALSDALIGVGYGVWMTQEFVDLMEWVKKYNSNKKEEEKVRFYGCDIQHTVLAAKKVKAYLQTNNKIDSTVEDGLNWLIERKYFAKNNKGNKQKMDDFTKKLDSSFALLVKEDAEYVLIEHSKNQLKKMIEIIFAKKSTQVALRDKFMAENIEWIYNYENKQKVIFWSHNEHVANNKEESFQKPTGYYLKEKFNTHYYSFGFGFYNGQNRTYNSKERKWVLNQIPNVSIKNSTDAIFKQCKYDNFILDFKTVENSLEINDFLNTDLFHRSIGATYYPENNKFRNYRKSKLVESFDGIIFFKETTPSRKITTYNNI